MRISDNDYMVNFANDVEETVDMTNIKNRSDLDKRLRKFFNPKYRGQKMYEPTEVQKDAFMRYYDVPLYLPSVTYITSTFKIKGKTVTKKRDKKTGRFIK